MRHKELLAHADFVKKLSRKLIADEQWSADVAQQACVAALEQSPPSDRPLGVWLSTVTKNLSNRLFQSENRRRKRERAVAATNRVPLAAGVAEREDMRQRVVKAVFSLNELSLPVALRSSGSPG